MAASPPRRRRAYRDLVASQPQPDKVLDGHGGLSPRWGVERRRDAGSASWDHTFAYGRSSRRAARAGRAIRRPSTASLFTPDGRNVVSAGYDTALRFWPLAGGPAITRTLAGAAQQRGHRARWRDRRRRCHGKVYFLCRRRDAREVEASAIPIIAVGFHRTGKLVAAAGIAVRWR